MFKITKYKFLKLSSKEEEVNDPIFRILFLVFYENNKINNILKYLHNFLQKYTSSLLLNILLLYLNIIGFSSYRLTLSGCNKTQQECLKLDLVTYYKSLVVYMAYSILIVGITITLSIWRYISFFHPFLIGYKYFLLYKEDHYSELSKHGQYNMVIFIIGVIIIIIIFNLFFILRALIKNKRYNLTIYLVILLFGIIFMKSLYYFENKSYCRRWGIGLNNTSINKFKNTSECSIIFPKKCPMNTYYGIMDFSKLLKIDCKNTNNINSRNLLLKYLKSDNPSYDFSNTSKFGYPNSNIYSVHQFDNIKHFNQKIISKILDYDNKTNLKYLSEYNKSEIILEFSNNYKDAKISINVSFRMNLSKERKLKENNKSIYNNVLFIFLDTLSRAHFQRAMKKTSQFVEKYMKYNNLYSAYQFNKYHSVGHETHPNIAPMYFGKPMKERRGKNIIKYFKKNGYITANIGNICSKELFATFKNEITNISFDRYDHENIAMWCDPNYFDRKNPYPINKGEFSLLRRCLYGKEVHEYVFEYAKDFWKKYENNRKFARLSFIEGHEITGEVIKYLDEPLYHFLNEFMKKGSLNNTSIIIASDHGLHYGIYLNTGREDALIEHFLPLLIFLLPNNRNNKIKLEELLINQDKFITPYDIYITMLFIAEGKNNSNIHYKYGNSLFGYINPKGRNCTKFKDEISKKNCKCIIKNKIKI
jgi:hypothetical protein